MLEEQTWRTFIRVLLAKDLKQVMIDIVKFKGETM